MKRLSKFIFWITGWKVVGEIPKSLNKFVMVAAPHTSNWDLFYARAAYFIMGIRLRYTIKSELFFFPLGGFLKYLGGIPIDRKKKGNTVEKMAALYEEWEELALLVTPEATRSYAAKWKKGFYYIALEAKVPIVCGYLDYEKKHAGIGPIITPGGDIEKDINEIKRFYSGITPKYPKKGVKNPD